MVKMPCFKTYCLETGVKTLVTEIGQQLPPSLFQVKTSKLGPEIFYRKVLFQLSGCGCKIADSGATKLIQPAILKPLEVKACIASF